MVRKNSPGERIAYAFFCFCIVLLCVITLYPFIYVFCYSVSESSKAAAKVVTIYPLGFTWDNYHAVFRDKNLINAFSVSVSRTLLGTLTTVAVTSLTAYSLSKRHLIAHKPLMWFFLIPMYFNAGMLPNFVMMSKYGLLDNFFVYILPLAFSTYYMIIFKSFFEQIPSALMEAAMLDGADDLKVFAKIVLPTSTPVLATIALFAGVQQWNSYFDGILYVSKDALQPLQTLMYKILQSEQAFSISQVANAAEGATKITAEGIKMSMLIVSTVPILCIYPFLQKYFVKGIMLGAVKG